MFHVLQAYMRFILEYQPHFLERSQQHQTLLHFFALWDLELPRLV